MCHEVYFIFVVKLISLIIRSLITIVNQRQPATVQVTRFH